MTHTTSQRRMWGGPIQENVCVCVCVVSGPTFGLTLEYTLLKTQTVAPLLHRVWPLGTSSIHMLGPSCQREALSSLMRYPCFSSLAAQLSARAEGGPAQASQLHHPQAGAAGDGVRLHPPVPGDGAAPRPGGAGEIHRQTPQVRRPNRISTAP